MLASNQTEAARRPWTLLPRVVVTFCCLWLVSSADRTWAQNYREQSPQVDQRQARAMRSRLTAVLNGASLSEENKKSIDDYYKGYLFPAMTSTTPTALADLADQREGLIRDLNTTRSQAARAHLLGVTMQEMTKIAGNNFHPAVRYNAVLVISQLDQQPAQAGGAPRPPEILPAATQRLLAIVKSTNSSAAPSPVKVAALVGLQRHARFGIDEQHAQQTTDVMLALINSPVALEDVSKDVSDWIRCQALQVLANQHAGGVNEAVSAAMVKLVADEAMSLDDRCHVASLLAESMFSAGAGGVNYDAYQTALGGLALEVFAAEEKKAVEYNDEVLQGQGGGFGRGGGGYGRGGGGRGGGYDLDGGGRGRGGYGGGRGGFGGGRGGFGLEEDQGPHYNIRRMLQRVMGVLTALEAVAPASSDPVQSRLNELKTPLRELADAAAERGALEVNVVKTVIQTSQAVNRIVDSWGTSEDPAASLGSEATSLVAAD